MMTDAHSSAHQDFSWLSNCRQAAQRNEWDACPVFSGFRAHRGSPQESGAFPAVSYARDFLPPHCARSASLFENR